jgi:hypothetical protein
MSPAFRTLSALTLSLGVASLPLTCGCSRPLGPESSQPASREPSDDQPLKVSAELEALAERLQAITAEVALSAERRVHGVHRAASYQADRQFPQRVRAVVMNVNVSWCNDGCIDGPAETPVKNEDLSLLKPFAESLETLDVQHTEITDAGLETIAHLTRLESLNLAGTAIDGRGLAHLGRLDKLRHLDLRDTAIQPEHLRTLSVLKSLRTIELPAAAITDEVLAVLGRLPHLRSLVLAKASVSDRGLASLAQLRLETLDASWLLRLIGKMPVLKRLDLRGRGLTASALAPLSSCTRLEYLAVRGIDEPGEPLAVLNAMSKLDQCLVLGCPRVGRIRLTKQAGVGRLYFKYGRLDELEIDGTSNLTAVYLGHEAHGYNDDDARLNKLEVGCLTVRNTANLLYLMVDGLESALPFTEISLADTPKLRSLLLRAPPVERQPIKCRLMTEGAFPNLVQRRLFHLRADRASLDRLNDSPVLRGGDMEEVEISRLFNGPNRAPAQLTEQEAGPLSASVMAEWEQAGAPRGSPSGRTRHWGADAAGVVRLASCGCGRGANVNDSTSVRSPSANRSTALASKVNANAACRPCSFDTW